jgi:type IV secretory pathway VirD2 relaxase
VVKAHVVRLSANGAKAARLHLRYIERDGVEKDGSKGLFYDADGPARRATFEQPRIGEQHQFRLIVSPEDAVELDLTNYVRRLMTRVEQDLGRRVEWAAVNHHDTGHPHAHIVIRGIDRDGRELRLDRSYISSGLRWRAQELATEELGPRQEFEIRRTRAKEITQERFTSLDRELERCAKDQRVEIRTLHRSAPADQSMLIGRLEQLEVMRLAERVAPSAWVLAEGWQAHLRELGEQGDILKQIHKAIGGNPARYHIVRAGDGLPTAQLGEPRVLWGRVASKGLSDELKGAFYAVLETPSGEAYHVPLDRRSADAIRPGDLVSFTSRPQAAMRPIDRDIAQAARAHDGVVALDRAASTDDSAQATRRRLRELERMGLAAYESPERWKVPVDLLDVLQQRQRDTPARHRLVVRREPLSLDEQVRYRGPVWLDRLDASSLAPYGFGTEVGRALEQRRETLRELGVAPDDPRRAVKLRDVEQQAVGKWFAAQSGQQFLSKVPPTFQGRIRPLGEHAPYFVVSDTVRFVLVPTHGRDLRPDAGNDVVVERDGRGRLLVRAAERDRGRGR